MPQLPVYTRNSRIQPSGVVRQNTNSVAEGLNEFGRAAADLAVKWQQTQNAAESLDGKNKMAAQIQDLITEANDYNSYQSPKDIEKKQTEVLDKLHKIVPDIVSGFNTDTNANSFVRNTELDVAKTEAQIKGLFRKKYIDNNEANLIVSGDRNRENFISTGDEAFRNSYIADLYSSYKNGFIDRETYTRRKQQTEGWDKYYIYRQAETDPQGVIDNLKAGKYKIKPEEYNDVLKGLNSIQTNDELLRKFEESARQNQGESDTMAFIYGDADYSEKLKYINDAEMRGNISGSYAQKARRAIKQFRPDGGKTMSEAQNIADVLQRAYDLNEGNFNSTEYLNGIRDLREQIQEAIDTGEITQKDGITLNNQLNQATRKRISQETNAVSYQYGKSIDYFREQLPPEFQNDAVRNLFYATQDIDDSLPDKEKQKIYRQKAVEVVDAMKAENRNAAEKILTETQAEVPEMDIPTMAEKVNLSEADFNRKIEHTAKKYGMTKEQALAEFAKRIK